MCGILLGRNRFLADVFSPYIKVMNSIPRIVLGSIFILWLGLGLSSKVALAQSLINEPAILLMDEPFSALDVQTRSIMSNELLSLWDQSRPSVIFVTHDLEEAIALADRVVVMTVGPGTVKGIYDIDLPRPRGAVQEIRFEPRFLELHRQIWESLREEVERAYARTASLGKDQR